MKRIYFRRKPVAVCVLTVCSGVYMPPVLSSSPWQANEGQTLEVNDGYHSATKGDIPLLATGPKSYLHSASNGLLFSASGMTPVAKLLNGGQIDLSGSALSSSGQFSRGVEADNGMLILDKGTLSATGDFATALTADHGSNITLRDEVVTVSGHSAQGVVIKDGNLSIDNSQIIAEGEAQGALSLAYGSGGNVSAGLNNVKLQTHGESGSAALRMGNAQVNGYELNISATGEARGIEIYNTGGEHGFLTINRGTVSSENKDAIYLLDGDVGLTNVDVYSAHGHALNVNKKARAELTGGRFETQGDNAGAVWLARNDTSASATESAFVTHGKSSHAFDAQYGNAEITDSLLETTGVGSYGLYTEKQVIGDGLTVISSGNGSAGIAAARGGNISLTDSNIAVTGDQSAGLMVFPGSTLSGDTMTITTEGASSSAIWGRASTLEIFNSTATARGVDGAGLFISAAADGSASKVLLDNSQIESKQGEAIRVQNGAALNLTVNEAQLVGGNGILLATGFQQPSADVNVLAGGSELLGDVLGQGARTTMILSDSKLTGSIQGVQRLDVLGSSQWNVTGDSSLARLDNSGTILYGHGDNGVFSGHTVRVSGDYLGDGGRIIFTSRLGGDDSPTDRLRVDGNTSGETRVKVINAGGHGAQTVEGLELISVGGASDGQFTREGRIVASLWDYDLVKKGKNWYLTSIEPQPEPPAEPETPKQPEDPGQNESTDKPEKPGATGQRIVRPEAGSYASNILAANTLFDLRLHERLGETRYTDLLTGEKKVTSMWLRNEGGHQRSRMSDDQNRTQANRYVMQMGGDLAQWNTSGTGRWHLGIMGGYANQKSQTSSSVSGFTSRGQVNGYSSGIYGTWYQHERESDGLYVDSWLQYNWFNAQVKGQDIAPEQYKMRGFTASLETGYALTLGEYQTIKGMTNTVRLEPQAQISWMDVKTHNHRESSQTLVQSEGQGNIQTRLGSRLSLEGRSVYDVGTERYFQPFAELNWIHNTHQFGVTMDGHHDYAQGTRNIGEAKLGVEGSLGRNLNIWVNVAQQIGDNSYSDTRGMLGIKSQF